ncbi:retrovirus-related pol polyprotein from transposon TNT 1-94 [Tanacetum coccineum]
MLPLEGYTKALLGQSKHDYSLFVKVKGEEFTAVLIYVDDMLITGNFTVEIQKLKQSLDHQFTIKTLVWLSISLGLNYAGQMLVHLNQRKYILDLLTDAGLTAAKPSSFPISSQIKLSLDKGTPLSDAGSYRRLVRRLLYLTMIRLDISYIVQHLSQFVSAPKDVHMQPAIHLLKYLKGSISKGLFYPVQPHLKMTGFSDADWASCLMTMRTKYLDIDCHFTIDKIQEGFLQTAFIPTHLQLADVMTKALGQVQYNFLVDKLGLTEAPT